MEIAEKCENDRSVCLPDLSGRVQARQMLPLVALLCLGLFPISEKIKEKYFLEIKKRITPLDSTRRGEPNALSKNSYIACYIGDLDIRDKRVKQFYAFYFIQTLM